MSTKAHHFFQLCLWGLFPNGSHCYSLLLYKVQFLLVHECQQKLIIYFQHCCGDYSPMVDAAHSCWFDPDVKKLGFSGINPQSTRNQILNLLTSLWGLFPKGCHCLFVLLYKVQFLWVHECCGDCSPMVVIVYFILLYKIQFFLVHECQQKLIIIFYFQICCGDCSPMVVIVYFLLLFKV